MQADARNRARVTDAGTPAPTDGRRRAGDPSGAPPTTPARGYPAAMPSTPPLAEFDAAAARALARRPGWTRLAAAREEIDDLNVYPVPDGDTGTNLHLTVESAAEAVAELAAGRGPRPRSWRPSRAGR